MLEVEEQVDQILKKQFIPVQQLSLDVTESTDNIPESQMTDTGYPLQQPVIVNSIVHVQGPSFLQSGGGFWYLFCCIVPLCWYCYCLYLTFGECCESVP